MSKKDIATSRRANGRTFRERTSLEPAYLSKNIYFYPKIFSETTRSLGQNWNLIRLVNESELHADSHAINLLCCGFFQFFKP